MSDSIVQVAILSPPYSVLSYTLPDKICKAIRMKRLTLSVTGQNLFYLTKSSLYSPEYGADDESGYGIPRTVLFGIQATF